MESPLTILGLIPLSCGLLTLTLIGQNLICSLIKLGFIISFPKKGLRNNLKWNSIYDLHLRR